MHANEGVVERAASKAMLKGEHKHKCLVACNRTRSLARSLTIRNSHPRLTQLFFLYFFAVVNALFSHSIKSCFDSEMLLRNGIWLLQYRLFLLVTLNIFFKCHRIVFLPVWFAFSLIILLRIRRAQQHIDYYCR